jgi:ParB family transcriptional regulator, chromosome partitioning protein
MSKQRGLGRGLGAFFPGSKAGAKGNPANSPAAGDRVAMIPIDAITANPFQPRHAFDEGELESLAQSIRENGILSPVLVRSSSGGGGNFQIVAGERRWRAARLAGLTELPALVREAEDANALELALLENLQRTDLNPIEEAAGYRQLMEDHGFTQEQLSRRLGKARSTVANALRLLSLSDSVQAFVRDGRLSGGHARALAGLSRDRAEKIARSAVDRGLNVRDVERLAAAASPPKKKAAIGPRTKTGTALSPDLADVETRLRFALATRVAIHPAATGGAIEIRYAGDEELQRIVDLICPGDA